jgi:hypothetical protein
VELASDPACLPENAGDGAQHQTVRLPPHVGTLLAYERQLPTHIAQIQAGCLSLAGTATLAERVLHSETGLLAHLTSLLDAVANRTCESGADEAFDLHDSLADTLKALDQIADDLRPVPSLVRALSTTPVQRPATTLPGPARPSAPLRPPARPR